MPGQAGPYPILAGKATNKYGSASCNTCSPGRYQPINTNAQHTHIPAKSAKFQIFIHLKSTGLYCVWVSVDYVTPESFEQLIKLGQRCSYLRTLFKCNSSRFGQLT